MRILVSLVLLAGCGDDARMDPDGGGPVDGGGGRDGATNDAGGGRDSGMPGDAGTSGYTEPVCDPMADLSDLRGAYSPTAFRSTMEEIATRRYPIGLAFIQGQSDMLLEAWYGGSPAGTFDQIFPTYEVAIHEGAHIWDFSNSPFGRHRYRLRDDLVIETAALDNFARTEILALHVDTETDFYDEVYLVGDSGMQGLNNLLDEYNAYVHSLATRYCVRDDIRPGFRTSARDGILTMMYYVELYLRVAREDHPDDYAEIIADPGHIEAILTIWDRAEFWLATSASVAELGINDAVIRTWTYDADNLAEIQRLRDL